METKQVLSELVNAQAKLLEAYTAHHKYLPGDYTLLREINNNLSQISEVVKKVCQEW